VERGDSIVMTRNDDYWGEKGIVKTIVFRWSSEAAQRFLELQSGTVDGIVNPGPDDFESIKNDSTLLSMIARHLTFSTLVY
jgi:ABC-type transport system substrate-binding protein